jgi:hypothetical protein
MSLIDFRQEGKKDEGILDELFPNRESKFNESVLDKLCNDSDIVSPEEESMGQDEPA